MSKLIELQTLRNPKYLFNPKNKEHISLLKQFLSEYKWGNPCPFLLEEPYLTIPDMMKDKYIKYQLGIV
jgi:hypothetical protein